MNTKRPTFVETRYYQTPPEDKSVEQCRSHGRDHAYAHWCTQIDPGWTDEQVDAYRQGYLDMAVENSGSDAWSAHTANYIRKGMKP